jgi:hypothetical protein
VEHKSALFLMPSPFALLIVVFPFLAPSTLPEELKALMVEQSSRPVGDRQGPKRKSLSPLSASSLVHHDRIDMKHANIMHV